jgi:hypothetical protein
MKSVQKYRRWAASNPWKASGVVALGWLLGMSLFSIAFEEVTTGVRTVVIVAIGALVVWGVLALTGLMKWMAERAVRKDLEK